MERFWESLCILHFGAEKLSEKGGFLALFLLGVKV